MRMHLIGAGLTGLVLLAAGGSAGAASFDCAKAGTADERAICADPVLSRLDDLLAKAHKEALAAGEADTVRQDARDFLADRRLCKDDACRIASYVAVLKQMALSGATTLLPRDITADTIAKGDAPASKALPEAVGHCVATTVLEVHPRLGNEGEAPTDADYDSGTGIDYANEGYQVSYEREPALMASKAGDTVTMCLAALPHRCPADDDRGREYTVTNQRTGDTWTLPDSQHACGGA